MAFYSPNESYALESRTLKNLKIQKFVQDLAFRQAPYSARNWGDSWHSLCSYQGKLKPSIAHFLVKEFTQVGDIVLDPLSGVGTIPLEARLQNRVAISNDISPLAATVSRAKVTCSGEIAWESHLTELEATMSAFLKDNDPLEHFEDFGLNRNITSYFEPQTLREILVLRELMDSDFKNTTFGSFLFSCFAHVLHGNRPYALSRRSHPLTPYAPSGEFIYKNTIEHIRQKATRALKQAVATSFPPGYSYEGDYENLSVKDWFGSVNAIITSPPFVGSLKFNNQNWMRLWLAGVEPQDFKKTPTALEALGHNTTTAYLDFLRFCYEATMPDGIVVLHTGKNSQYNMADEIAKLAKGMFASVDYASEDVGLVEKHGIRDKGATTEHQFILLKK